MERSVGRSYKVFAVYFLVLVLIASTVASMFYMFSVTSLKADETVGESTREEQVALNWKYDRTSTHYPRWKPSFSCATYQAVHRIDRSLLEPFDMFGNEVAGSHHLKTSKAFGGVISKTNSAYSCEIATFEQLNGYSTYLFENEHEGVALEPHNVEMLGHLRDEFMPKYYGFYQDTPGGLNRIVSQDVTREFIQPTVADLTIQPRYWGPTETIAVKGITNVMTEGQAAGRTLDVDYIPLRDAWGEMTDEQVEDCLATMFYDGSSLRLDVLRELIPLVERAAYLIHEQTYYLFADSSLLVLYETDEQAVKVNGTKARVFLLDFDEAVPYWVDITGEDARHKQEQDMTVNHLLSTLRKIAQDPDHWTEKFTSPDEVVKHCPTMHIADDSPARKYFL